MGTFHKVKTIIGRSPLTTIEFIIACSAVVGGLYSISPLIQFSATANGVTGLTAVLSGVIGTSIFGAVYLIAAVVLLAGIFLDCRKLRTYGLFLIGLCRMYILIATWIAVGLLPFTWLGNATVMVITFYIWLKIKSEDHEQC